MSEVVWHYHSEQAMQKIPLCPCNLFTCLVSLLTMPLWSVVIVYFSTAPVRDSPGADFRAQFFLSLLFFSYQNVPDQEISVKKAVPCHVEHSLHMWCRWAGCLEQGVDGSNGVAVSCPTLRCFDLYLVYLWLPLTQEQHPLASTQSSAHVVTCKWLLKSCRDNLSLIHFIINNKSSPSRLFGLLNKAVDTTRLCGNVLKKKPTNKIDFT